VVDKAHLIYATIYDWLHVIGVNLSIVKEYSAQPSISIYFNGQLHAEYPKSAVSALLNFTTEPKK
jgi:hypothetical protein